MAKNAAGSGSTKPTKEEKKAAKAEKRAAGKERRTQLWQAFQMQRKQDKKLLPYMIGAVVGTAAVLTLALMWFLPWWAVLLILVPVSGGTSGGMQPGGGFVATVAIGMLGMLSHAWGDFPFQIPSVHLTFIVFAALACLMGWSGVMQKDGSRNPA